MLKSDLVENKWLQCGVCMHLSHFIMFQCVDCGRARILGLSLPSNHTTTMNRMKRMRKKITSKLHINCVCMTMHRKKAGCGCCSVLYYSVERVRIELKRHNDYATAIMCDSVAFIECDEYFYIHIIFMCGCWHCLFQQPKCVVLNVERSNI